MSDAPESHGAATVSVIIPAFQSADCIGAGIHSVLAQSRPVEEIIVVDDGSDDHLRDVLPAGVRYVRHDVNRGSSASRNTGARLAKGNYLVFLDADDTLAPDAIEKMLAAVEQTGASWCITDMDRYENGKIDLWRCLPENPDPLVAILAGDFIMSGVFFRREDFEAVGMYDEALRARVDWDINIRMIEAGKLYCYLAEPLYRYHRREGSIQTSQIDKVLDCTERIFVKHHRRLAPRSRQLSRALGAATWHLGRNYWQAKHHLIAIYYVALSILRERSLRRAGRVLKRVARRVIPSSASPSSALR